MKITEEEKVAYRGVIYISILEILAFLLLAFVIN